MHKLTLYAGQGKDGSPEAFDHIDFHPGELYAIVGATGSGKSQLIKDIEELSDGSSLTKRRVLLDDQLVALEDRYACSTNLVSHLSQNMRFVLDTTVGEFLDLHARCKQRLHIQLEEVLATANSIADEPLMLDARLSALSGGQTRALMIADIAHISNNPIVLIDEIENAGINKTRALEVLLDKDKLIFIVTHDPYTALLADKRIIVARGSIQCIRTRSQAEEELSVELKHLNDTQFALQQRLRQGEGLEETLATLLE